MNYGKRINYGYLGQLLSVFVFILLCFPSFSSEAPICKQSFAKQIKTKFVETYDYLSSELQIKLRKQKLASELRYLGRDIQKIKVSEFKELGFELNDLNLEALSIPREALKYFDYQTGEFNYRPESKINLIKENGDKRVEKIKINAWNKKELGAAQVRMVLRALESDPKLIVELYVRRKLYRNFGLENKLNELPENVRERLRFSIYEGAGHTAYARDNLYGLADGGVYASAYSRDLKYSLDKVAYKERKQHSSYAKVEKSIFKIYGGNIVVGEKNIFMGYDIVKESARDLRISEKKVRESLRKEFAKEIIFLGVDNVKGETKQVDYHIDLTMTVVRNKVSGKEEIWLASSDKAFDILQKEVGNDYFSAGLKHTFWHPKIKDREERLKTLKAYLESQGYFIRMVPNFFHEDLFSGHDSASLYEYKLRPFNYVNVIWSSKNVFTSSFGVKAIDQYMFKLYREIGYEPVDLKYGAGSLVHQAGVRCNFCSITKDTHLIDPTKN